MNKYVISICDYPAEENFIVSFSAKSLSDCEDKITDYLSITYDFTEGLNFQETKKNLWEEAEVLLSDIIDVEEL
jgi:hypothetical protein